MSDARNCPTCGALYVVPAADSCPACGGERPLVLGDPPRVQVLGDQGDRLRLPTIVAEVSRNWKLSGCRGDGPVRLISQDLERVIEGNRRRGYTLRDWRLVQTWLTEPEPHLLETIVAVFDLTLLVVRSDQTLADRSHGA